MPIICERCRQETNFTKLGIFIMPPIGESCVKYHLCFDCSMDLLGFIKTNPADQVRYVETVSSQKGIK